jgi:GH43 family beta-xylosidase
MAKKSKKQVSKAMCVDEYKPKRYAPRITFTEDDIAGLKDLKVGDTHEITIKGKLVKLAKDEYEWESGDNNKLSGTFKIVQADNKSIESNYDDDEDD